MGTLVRRFWIDYRNAAREMALGPVAIGLAAGMTTHEGILPDLLNAVFAAAIVMAVGPTTIVLIRRIAAIRRSARDSGADTRGRHERFRI
jgi:hypothetical protein